MKNREGETPLDLEPFFYFSPYPLYPGVSEEAKGNEGDAYASRKGIRRKSFVESEDESDPWMNQATRSRHETQAESFPVYNHGQRIHWDNTAFHLPTHSFSHILGSFEGKG